MVLFGLHVSCLVDVEAFKKIEVETLGPFQIHMLFIDRLTFGWTTKWMQKNQYVLRVGTKDLSNYIFTWCKCIWGLN